MNAELSKRDDFFTSGCVTTSIILCFLTQFFLNYIILPELVINIISLNNIFIKVEIIKIIDFMNQNVPKTIVYYLYQIQNFGRYKSE